MHDLDALVGAPPSPVRWADVMEALSGLEGPALSAAIERCQGVRSWPARLRRIEPDCPWLGGLFEGKRDPRLVLVGWASVRHVHEYPYLKSVVREPELMAVVAAFARHIDASFCPPDVVIDQGDEIRYASGCGGGQAWQKRGNEAQGVLFRDSAVEHSADMASDGSWDAYGMSEGCAVRVWRHDFIGGEMALELTGPAAPVFDAAAAWGELVGGQAETGAVLRRLAGG